MKHFAAYALIKAHASQPEKPSKMLTFHLKSILLCVRIALSGFLSENVMRGSLNIAGAAYMISKLKIAVILLLVFAASPVWADLCSADRMHPLASCVYSGTENNPTASGSFEQLYEVQNGCGHMVEVVIQLSDGKELLAILSDGQKKWQILDEGVEVTGFYCCADDSSCEVEELY